MSIVAAVAASLAVATLGLANTIDVEGTYELDKVEMVRTIAAQMNREAKGVPLPPGLAVLAVSRMETTIELEAYGQLKMTVTVLSFDPDVPSQHEVAEGTWTTNSQSILLTFPWGNANTKTINCSLSSSRMRCEPLAKGQPAMIFKKVATSR
jgi:hypothetical protein